MKKNLTYPEIYTSISRLADPQMTFVNMFKANPENNLISGIVYFPYIPRLIEDSNLNVQFIIHISHYLKINAK